jgi:hypothetical protein
MLIQRTLDRLRLATGILLSGDNRKSFRREIPAISPDEIAEAKLFFPRQKFFIFGHARSGTTLLTRLVRLHPQVYCNYQAHFFTRQPLLESLVEDPAIEAWLSRRSNRWNRGRDLSPVVLRAVADFILEREARRSGKSIVGDKSPNSLLDGEAVRLMHKIYPDAKLIYIVRDGRDTAVSHRIQSFIDADQHLTRLDLEIREAFAADPVPFMDGKRSIFSEKAIRQAAESWVKNVNETDLRGKELYQDQYLSLRYELLVQEPYTQMKRVWDFLGADTTDPNLQGVISGELQQNPDADWQQLKAGELIAPLQKGKQGSWRELFTPRDRQIFKAIAGQTLIEWGYESDLNW